jgi:zinc/manganese transport system substrate-binding protein
MKRTLFIALIVALVGLATDARAQGKLNVVGTTEDLAAIAQEVGGDRITIDSLAKGYQDPHFVEAKPSFILKLQKADLLIVVGQLEIGWLPPLIQQSRNAKVQAGAGPYLDASLREFSTFRQARSPRHGRLQAGTALLLDPRTANHRRDIAASCRSTAQRQGVSFDQRLADFTNRVNDGVKAGRRRWRPRNVKVVTYTGRIRAPWIASVSGGRLCRASAGHSPSPATRSISFRR